MSIKLISQAFDLELPASEKMVLMVLCNYADEEGVAYPSVPTIATKASLSERQTRRLLNQLQDDGYVEVTGRKKIYGRFVNLYRVDLSPPDNMSGVEDPPPDTGVRRDLSPVSPKPSENRQVQKTSSSHPKVRMEMFEAMHQVWLGRSAAGERITRSARARINAAVKEALAEGITPDEFLARGKRYKLKWPGMAASPQAVLANWPALHPYPTVREKSPTPPDECEHPRWADVGDDIWVCVVCHTERDVVTEDFNYG